MVKKNYLFRQGGIDIFRTQILFTYQTHEISQLVLLWFSPEKIKLMALPVCTVGLITYVRLIWIKNIHLLLCFSLLLFSKINQIILVMLRQADYST